MVSLTYGRLREWYLATLRKRIVSRIEASQLSPAAQIVADRKAIEQLILAKAAREEMPAVLVKPGLLPMQCLLYLGAGIPVVIQLLLGVLILSGILPLSRYWLVGLGLLLAIIAAIAVTVIFHRWIILPLQLLIDANANNATKAVSEYDILTLLQSLVNRLNKSIFEAAKREESIADYSSDLICAFDLQGKFCALSPSCAEFLGYSEFELIGSNLKDFLVSDDLDKTVKFLQAMPEATGAVPFENRFKRGNGKLIHIAWLAEWSKTEQSLFCVGRDVSSQRQLERIKQEFVSMIGDDLKTPINSVATTLEKFEACGVEGLSPAGLELVQNARQGIARILNLINDLLDLEKMEEGRLSIRPEPISLATALDRSIKNVLSSARASGIDIKNEYTDAIVMADEDRLMQTVSNILANAIKYSPSDGVISIRSSVTKGIAIIAIKDEGPGIPTIYQDTVFERFVQLSVDGNTQGAGLGLAICRAIITAHGGTIGLNSTPGSGSTFWFTLPLSRQALT